MGIFWKKPLFWIVFFLIILIIIPLFFYFFKDTIISLLPSSIKTENQTPVEPKAGSCLILEEQFCSKAEAVEWFNPSGERFIRVGFKLPKGTSVLMPIDGNVSRGTLPDKGPVKGFRATVADPNNPNPLWYIFDGNLEWITPSPHEKGKPFAKISTSEIENPGGYTLFFYINKGLGMDTKSAEDELRRMFPDIL